MQTMQSSYLIFGGQSCSERACCVAMTCYKVASPLRSKNLLPQGKSLSHSSTNAFWASLGDLEQLEATGIGEVLCKS